jgi:hypothetical protein
MTARCITLSWIDRTMDVPLRQVAVPLAALGLALLGSTIHRTAIPHPSEPERLGG